MFSQGKKRKADDSYSDEVVPRECAGSSQKKLKISHDSLSVCKFNVKSIFDNFHFGDLVFGLENHYRSIIVKQLADRGYSFTYANELNMPTVRYILSTPDKSKINQLPTYQKSHYEFLLTHKNYLIAPGGKPLKNFPSEPSFGSAIRRACKLLACSGSSIRYIHFELDGIDIKRVCKADPKDLGVANSELKAVYRQSKVFENPYLFFYLQGNPVPPPWKMAKNTSYFKNYDAYRARKKK